MTDETAAERVNGIFRQLAAGDISGFQTAAQDGWETTLPSGKTVSRSTLQTAATAVAAVGPEAVPLLLPRTEEANDALRYVAVRALEEITGEDVHLAHFDRSNSAERARAVESWKHWYATSGGKP